MYAICSKQRINLSRQAEEIIKKENELVEIASRLTMKKASPNPTTLYVQDNNREYLEGSDIMQLVGKYYKNTWQFIKAVIEEYAQ